MEHVGRSPEQLAAAESNKTKEDDLNASNEDNKMHNINTANKAGPSKTNEIETKDNPSAADKMLPSPFNKLESRR